MNIWTWSMRLRPRATTIELRLQTPEQDLLRAVLPRPKHPRALVTVLEGLALWQGAPLHVVVCVDESSQTCGLTGLGLDGDRLDDPRSPLLYVTEMGPGRSLRLRRRPRAPEQWDLDLTGGGR